MDGDDGRRLKPGGFFLPGSESGFFPLLPFPGGHDSNALVEPV